MHDKTGTLTEAKIALIRHITLSGADSERVLELAWLNSHFESGLRSPLDAAILEHVSSIPAGWTKIDEVPFDFERRLTPFTWQIHSTQPRCGSTQRDEAKKAHEVQPCRVTISISPTANKF